MTSDISIVLSPTSAPQSNNVQIKLGSVKENNVIQINCTNQNKDQSIFALAKAFLSISEMTHKKLQMLCYYAKAWYLAFYDRNLIDEQFEAWVNGAVQPALYQKYKKYQYGDIPKLSDTGEIPEEFLSFAQEVYRSYGHLTGYELEVVIHQEDPWIEARGNCKPWECCHNHISEDSMKKYYRKMIA